MRRNLSVVVTADVIGSQKLPDDDRLRLTVQLQKSLDDWNDAFSHAIGSHFTLTRGDEFQGLLTNPSIIPELLWRMSMWSPTRLRVGIGYGNVFGDPSNVLLMDGEAFHNARRALETAEARWDKHVAYVGFPDDWDPILAGITGLLEVLSSRMTAIQREVVSQRRSGRTNTQIAAGLGVTRQAVAKTASAAGTDAYLAGEQGLERALSKATTR